MYKYIITTFTETIGINNGSRIYYAGSKATVESKFAHDIYNATLFTTAAEATSIMDALATKYANKAFSIDLVSIVLTLL